LFYTDGLIEAQNTDRNFFGDMRLKEILQENYNKSASELSKLISDGILDLPGKKKLKMI